MKSAAKDNGYGAAIITAGKCLRFQIHLADAEKEDTPWTLADTERVTIQLETQIYGITSNEQTRFKTEFSIQMIEFDAWWESIDIQALQKTIEQHGIHFGYPKMHLVS
jgi:hypothetical protein